MEACYQLLQSCSALPWGHTMFSSIKKPHNVVFYNKRHRCLGAPMSRLTNTNSSINGNNLRAISDDKPKPWYNLLGMSLVDLHEQFPESLWDIIDDDLNTLRKKDQEPNRGKWSDDRDLHYKFVESIVFDRKLYKYEILGCKIHANQIMNEGLISACDRDKIIHSLEKIEDEIEQGKFEWIDGADVHANIVEALAGDLGDLAKDLAMDNKYESCLMILETWCKYCIDQILTQTKQLQAALLVLAIRADGSVFPEDNTLLESLVLQILKVLEQDASLLRCLLGRIYSSSDDVTYLINSGKRFTIADFAKLVNHRLHGNLIHLLENKFLPWKNLLCVAPYDESAIYDTLHGKFTEDKQKRNRRNFALSRCLNIRDGRVSGQPEDYEIQDAKYHLFTSVTVLLEMLDLSMNLVKNMSSRLTEVMIPLPRSYDDIIGFAHLLTSKGFALETAYAVVHLCLENKVQPCELTPDQLRRVDFPSERARDLQQGNVPKFTCRDASKELIKWCCRLRIDPETIRR